MWREASTVGPRPPSTSRSARPLPMIVQWRPAAVSCSASRILGSMATVKRRRAAAAMRPTTTSGIRGSHLDPLSIRRAPPAHRSQSPGRATLAMGEAAHRFLENKSTPREPTVTCRVPADQTCDRASPTRKAASCRWCPCPCVHRGRTRRRPSLDLRTLAGCEMRGFQLRRAPASSQRQPRWCGPRGGTVPLQRDRYGASSTTWTCCVTAARGCCSPGR